MGKVSTAYDDTVQGGFGVGVGIGVGIISVAKVKLFVSKRIAFFFDESIKRHEKERREQMGS